MIFKELLNTVRFDDVAPHIVRMYPDMENSLGWFKIHFDMLRHMVPVFHENSNSKTPLKIKPLLKRIQIFD